MTDAHALLK